MKKLESNPSPVALKPIPGHTNVPDFRKSICLVVRDKNGNEMFRSPPFLNVVEAEYIGDSGPEEFFEIGLMPADNCEIPGLVWNKKMFHWNCERAVG